MNRIRWVGALVLLSLFGAAVLRGLPGFQPSNAASDGMLVIAPDVVECDIGDGRGPTRKVALRVINSSRVVQLVDSVKASCGCTMAKPLETTRLEPGASIPLEVTLRLPDYGQRTTFLRVQYGGQGESTAVVRFEVRGKRPTVPSFNGGPFRQFTIQVRPDDPENVENVVRVTTLEEVSAEPWIIGVDSSDSSLCGSIKGMSEVASEEGGDLVTRTYEVALRSVRRRSQVDSKPVVLHLLAASATGRETHDVSVVFDVVEAIRFVPPRLSIRRSGNGVDAYHVALLSNRSTAFEVVSDEQMSGLGVTFSPPRQQGSRTLNLVTVRLHPEKIPAENGPPVIKFRAVDAPFETALLPVDLLD